MDIHSHVDMKMKAAQAVYAQKMKSKIALGMYPKAPNLGVMPMLPAKEEPPTATYVKKLGR